MGPVNNIRYKWRDLLLKQKPIDKFVNNDHLIEIINKKNTRTDNLIK